MRNLFEKFNSLKGASFIGLRNYTAKTSGERSNVILNTNVNVMNAKIKDLESLKSFKDLDSIANNLNINKAIVEQAHNELINSAIKNVSENKDDRTVNSQAQTDAFVHLGKGLKFHKDTLQLHISGMVQSKEVIEKGTFKEVKSRPKTLAKKAIQKAANLKMLKHRTYIVGNLDTIKIKGTEIELI